MENYTTIDTKGILESKKDFILTLLKENGLTEEIKAEIIDWTIQQEDLVETTRGSIDFNKNSINFNIDRAEFYIALGDIDGAIESLYETIEQAKNENEGELTNKIRAKLDYIYLLRKA